MPVSRGQAISLGDLNALASLANTVLSPGTPYDFTGGGWMTVLNQIRTDLLERFFGNPSYSYGLTRTLSGILERTTIPPFALRKLPTVSGPWVVKTIGSGGGFLTDVDSFMFSEVEFWHAAGTPATLLTTALLAGSAYALANELNNEDVNGRTSSIKSEILIAGGGLLTCGVYPGYPSFPVAPAANEIWVGALKISAGTDTSGLSVTCNIPGSSVAYNPYDAANGAQSARIILSGGNVPAGLYTLTASVSAGNWKLQPGATSYPGDFRFKDLTLTGGAATTEAAMAVEASGSVNKEIAPGTGGGGWPWGIHIMQKGGGGFLTSVDMVDGALFTPAFGDVFTYLVSSKPRWEVDVEGLFVAKTIPVDRENAVIDDLLPFTKSGGASTMQSKAPDPDTANIKGVIPAVSYRMARYPATKNAVTISGWTVAKGMCLTRVVVRRPPQLVGNIYKPATVRPALTVDIGYYVGATFMMLGTITIPEDEDDAVQDVFWPVFGTIPLRYAVREDAALDPMVHVFVNYQPPYMSGTRIPATFPIVACLYNDLEAILSAV